MAFHSSRHATGVVEQFKELIGEELAPRIDAEHFAQLSLMIESAIDTAVLMRMERVAAEIAGLAERLRHDAESYG